MLPSKVSKASKIEFRLILEMIFATAAFKMLDFGGSTGFTLRFAITL